MASLINVAGLTLSPEEARDVSSLIIEKLFVHGALSDYHDIETGVHYKMQIPFVNNIEDSLVKSVGCVPAVGTGITMTEKFWEPEIFDSRWIHCAADLNKLLKIFNEKTRINPDFYDKIGSKEMGLIVGLIDKMMIDKLPVKVWFSDKTASITPAGKFKVGANLALYNVIDGLFKQIFAEVAAGDSNYVAITENAGASYVAQKLPVDAGYNYLAACFTAADSRLLQDPSAMFQVTRSIADNYRASLRDKTLGAGFRDTVENGVSVLLFEGYKVAVRHDWDINIKKLFDNGTKIDKPHRIVFTTPGNIPIATPSVDDFTTLDSFYDRTLKSNITDAAFALDAKLLEDYMTVAAY